MLQKLFTDHPADVGESYFQHFGESVRFSATMFVGSLACLVHAIIPALCVRTGSGIIRKLHDRMVVNRTKQRPFAE
ncbi:DUF6356 family protein [Sphingomonas cavernae]|uniref:Capsule biosynthesis protein n=1 Tax=Sphingomonas cavernae TaxID=2320861 RepID=A0A418W722_9SPHN|nr:DUF6356 family protein [Sphingomonas cavernae]RJF85846.1 hypothetical protein D3876_18435 [Sphingomonas cavernae]